jgi:hypothetical protein
MQSDRGFARARISFDQVKMLAWEAASENVVEPSYSG